MFFFSDLPLAALVLSNIHLNKVAKYMHKAGILLNICISEVGTLYRFLAFFFLSPHFRSVQKSICVVFFIWIYALQKRARYWQQYIKTICMAFSLFLCISEVGTISTTLFIFFISVMGFGLFVVPVLNFKASIPFYFCIVMKIFKNIALSFLCSTSPMRPSKNEIAFKRYD